MNGVVELTVTVLELVQPEAELKAVRVKAANPATGDVISIAVRAEDAPPIGSTIQVRITQEPAP